MNDPRKQLKKRENINREARKRATRTTHHNNVYKEDEEHTHKFKEDCVWIVSNVVMSVGVAVGLLDCNERNEERNARGNSTFDGSCSSCFFFWKNNPKLSLVHRSASSSYFSLRHLFSFHSGKMILKIFLSYFCSLPSFDPLSLSLCSSKCSLLSFETDILSSNGFHTLPSVQSSVQRPSPCVCWRHNYSHPDQ